MCGADLNKYRATLSSPSQRMLSSFSGVFGAYNFMKWLEIIYQEKAQ